MTVASPSTELNTPTPYLVLGESLRRDLTRRLRECIERWRREWADEHSPQFRLELREGRIQSAASDWHGAACFYVGATQRPGLMFVAASRIAPWLIGLRSDGLDGQRSNNSSTLAARLEIAALTALARGIFDAAGMQLGVIERGAAVAEAAMRELISARYVRSSVWPTEGGSYLEMLISPAIASALLPTQLRARNQERMERRLAAVAEQAVGVEVVLGNAEICVADLARLAVGDVIVMNESLSDPGELRVRAGGRVAAVSAGWFAGRRAVQIKTENRKGET